MASRRTCVAALLTGIVAVLAAGCSSGAHRSRVVLEMASGEPAGTEHFPAMQRFADRVSQLSHGTMRVEVKLVRINPQFSALYPAGGRTLLGDVARGSADLAWVDTGVFDTLGDDSFDALDAPLLIDDYATESAVVRSALPARMLADTRKLGVVGLAVLAGRLRKPVGFRRPLRAPRDYRGMTLRTLDSLVLSEAASALGARPQHGQWFARQRIVEGSVDGMEDDLDSVFFEDSLEEPTYVTANVNLWPRTAAIIMNPRRLAGLTPEQRGWIRRAARDAATYSTTVADKDAQLAHEFCADGGRLATASPGDLAALATAFRPVYARLRRNPETKALIRRIEAIKRGVRPSPALRIPAGCTTATKPAADAAKTAATTVPNGVYRVKITAADLRAGGVAASAGLSGTFTLNLHDGRWRLQQREGGSFVGGGTYSGSPQRVTWIPIYPPSSQHPPPRREFSMRFIPGRLVISVVNDDDNTDTTWFSAHPWTKIG